jgi:hypothetical protein
MIPLCFWSSPFSFEEIARTTSSNNLPSPHVPTNDELNSPRVSRAIGQERRVGVGMVGVFSSCFVLFCYFEKQPSISIKGMTHHLSNE